MAGGSLQTSLRSTQATTGVGSFSANGFPYGAFASYSFHMPPSAAGQVLCFYLVRLGIGLQDLIAGTLQQFVLLPEPGTYGGASYMLAAAFMTAAEHTALQVIAAQPAGWMGTIEEARAFLRANDLIHHWWMFDSFLSRTGVLESGEVRSL